MSKHDSKAPVHSLDVPKVSTIEYNLNIKNTDKVIEMTGGADTIKSKMKHGLPLEFKFRPDDKYSHPIEGNAVHCESMILKIKVNKRILHERFQGDLRKYLKFMDDEQRNEYEALQKQKMDEKNKTEKFLNELQIAASEKRSDAENDELIKNIDENIENVSNTNHPEKQIEHLPLIVEPVAISNKTYRFRELADYQYITKNDKFRQQVEESILAGNYEKIKEINFEKEKYPWSADGDRPLKNTMLNLVPPPTFTSIKIPLTYKYAHNNYAVPIVNPITGETQLVAGNRVASLNSRLIAADGIVPMKRDAKCSSNYFSWKKALIRLIKKYAKEYKESNREIKLFQWDPESLFEDTKFILNENVLNQSEIDLIVSDPEYRKPLRYLQCVTFISKLIEEKKIISRVKVYAMAPNEYALYLKRSIPFAAYSFRNGPFRSMLIKYGTDPRTSKEFMPSQMESYRVVGVYNMTSEIVIRTKFMNRGDKQYDTSFFIFDGKQFPNMLSFNIEDLKDPDILKIFELNSDILYSDKFVVKYGWLNPRVAENVRNVMRIKLPCLYKGVEPPAERIASYVVRVDDNEDDLEKANKFDTMEDTGEDADIDDEEDSEEEDDDDDDDEREEEEDESRGNMEFEPPFGNTNGDKNLAADASKPFDTDGDVLMGNTEEAVDSSDHNSVESSQFKDRKNSVEGKSDLLKEIKDHNPKMYEKLARLNGILKSNSYESMLQ